jgi:F-type H+-transporting ATPase subunit b
MLHLQLSTIIFQMLNFLILLAVLAWFFYRPLLRVMKTREETIDARIRRADEQAQAAEAERAQLDEQRRLAAVQADEMLASAREQAADEHERVLASGAEQVSRLLAEANKNIEERERIALAQLEAQLCTSAVGIAGSLIRDTAGPEVHEKLIARFLAEGIQPSRLNGYAPPEFHPFAGQVTIELAYAATEEREAELTNVLTRDLGIGDPASVSFQIVPGLIAGLRLVIGEFVLDFSVRHTLEQLVAQKRPSAVTS